MSWKNESFTIYISYLIILKCSGVAKWAGRQNGEATAVWIECQSKCYRWGAGSRVSFLYDNDDDGDDVDDDNVNDYDDGYDNVMIVMIILWLNGDDHDQDESKQY